VIVEAVVMDEVVVIVALRIAMPSFVASVPGIVSWTAVPNAWPNMPTSKASSMPTSRTCAEVACVPGKASTAHSSEMSTAEMTAAHATEVSATKVTSAETTSVSGVCLPR
jgi:hypothetical protein